MEKFISFPKTHTEPWLSFCSTLLDAEPNFIFLTGAGLLVLYLWYLILKPFLPSLCKTKGIRKPQGRADKGRKPTFRDQRSWQREAEEVRKLLSVLSIVQSCPGQPYNPSGFQQLLCPDLPCGCGTTDTATKVSRLLCWASLEDEDSSLSSWASRSLVTGASFPESCTRTASPQGHPTPGLASESSTPYPSTVSPKELSSLENFISLPPLGDSVTSESASASNSKLPAGYIPLQKLPSSPPPTQSAKDPVLHPQAAHSLMCRQSELSTDFPTTEDKDSAICTISKCSQQHNAACNLPLMKSMQSVSQGLLKKHSLEAPLGSETTDSPEEPKSQSSTDPGDLPPREGRDQSKEDFLTINPKMGISKCFQKPLSNSWIASESSADRQDFAVSNPLGSSNRQPEEMPMEMPMPRQGRDPKSSEEQEEQKHHELFFGHPSVKSESRIPMASGSAASSEKSNSFRRISASPVLAHPTPLSSSESQPQSSAPNLPESQSLQLPPDKTKVLPPSPILTVPSSPVSKLQGREVCLHSSQDEAQPLMPSETHHQEENILKKEQKRVWALPLVVKKSQQEFSPAAPKLSVGKESSRAHVPRPIPPVDFPLTSEFGKKMEHHLKKRLIQQCWGLPQRVLESWSQMDFHMSPPVSSERRSSYGENSQKTGRVPKGILGPQDTKSLNCKKELCSELNFKSESRQHVQGLRPSNKMSMTSENLFGGHNPPVTHDQGPTCGDKAAPQAKQVSLEEGNTCLGTPHPRAKMHPTQHKPPEETSGSNTATSLSEKGQPPLKNQVIQIK